MIIAWPGFSATDAECDSSQWIDSMKPIRSHNVEFDPTDLILRSHAKHGVSKDGRSGTALPATVLRDAVLRTAPLDEVD